MKLRDVLLVLSGCLATVPAALAADQLVVYSGRSDKFVKPVVEAFTQRTGIPVLLHSGSSTALLNKLQAEGAKTQADLYVSNDAGNLEQGSELGLFEPMPAELVGAIPNNLRAADNTWVGLSARARVLVVNTNAAGARDLSSVFDLARPELKGRIGITHSSNESYIAGVTVYMQAVGSDKVRAWLQAMKANAEDSVFSKHSHIVKAVAEGKKDVGLVNHYYIYRHLDKDPNAPIRVVLPDQGADGMGVAWNVAGVAVSKHSAKRDAALKLVAFLVSPEGQKIFAEANREYPTLPGVAADPAVPAAGSYKVAPVAMAELGRQRGATIDLIESVGMP